MNKRSAPLDALRGVAILLVIAAHFGGSFMGREAGVLLGNAGVILFFFLSGFLMDQTLARDGRIAAFAIRRAFRIFPAYWLSLAVVILFGASFTVPQLIANATFTAPIFGEPRMLGVYWTLYIEVMFYCLAPFIRRHIALSILGAALLLTIVNVSHGLGAGAPVYMLFCMCGMHIGSWQRGQSDWRVSAAMTVLVSAVANAILPLPYFFFIVPLCCAVALAVSSCSRFRIAPLEFTGRASYSWYLLHSIFGYSFGFLPVPLWASLLFGASATLLISWQAFLFIEKPFIRLARLCLDDVVQYDSGLNIGVGRAASD